MKVFDVIQKEKIVPVVKLEHESDALPLADALLKGGIRVAEITFRTSAAAGAIKTLRNERPDMLVGAGTVLTMDQLSEAIDAGAQFVVAPGFNPRIVEACLSQGVPMVPGVNNPSHVEAAMDMGLEILKFFPAELSGGIPMLKTLATVYPVKFMPTGGLKATNMIEYLKLSNVIACGGSWMVKPDLISSGDFKTITELSSVVRETLNKAFR
ncbi:MAG: bifunctional 4-hydroxy-2-oxoglutarate aldolase/2-dehydro-3-deoxy-phosphogluconate aldolase [Bacteroidetes bacterium]|nr:bifunctional 4-hydroxy-2-oxoglutarate aldolase/2-dehydro-3-deoxy-phosphogluconate aldolase [Bacteroidota bacterium]